MNAEARVEEMNWPEVIESAREKFLEIQPEGMQFTAERAFAIQLLKANDYLMKVAKGNPSSLQSAMLNVAAIGLSLNPAKKQAYLVPRGGRICLDCSYMGFCDMATMTGTIKWLQANCVYENDTFIDNGPGHEPKHQYSPFAKKADRGAFAGAYCVAKTADGDYLTTIMTAEEINNIKGRSETGKKNTGPWVTDFEEMAKKSVVRRAFKMLPKAESLDRLALAVQLSNEAEEFQPIVSSPDLGQYTEEQKKYFDNMITQSRAVDMFLFSKSLDEATFTNLYHSFEKGQKGKYQGIVDKLMGEGGATLRDIAESVSESATNGHDFAIVEALEGLSADAIDWVRDQLNAAQVAILNTALESAQ